MVVQTTTITVMQTTAIMATPDDYGNANDGCDNGSGGDNGNSTPTTTLFSAELVLNINAILI